MSAERGPSVMTRATATISRGGESSGRSVSLSSRISSPRMTSSKAGVGGLPEFKPSAPNSERQAKGFSFKNSGPFSKPFTGSQLERGPSQGESRPAKKVNLQKATGENIARSIISQENIRTSRIEKPISIDRKIKTRQFSASRDGLPMRDQARASIDRAKQAIPSSIDLRKSDLAGRQRLPEPVILDFEQPKDLGRKLSYKKSETTVRRFIKRPSRFMEEKPKDLDKPYKKILFDAIPHNESKSDRDLSKQIRELVRSKGLEKTQQILRSQGEKVSITTIFRLAISDQAKTRREEFKQERQMPETGTTINADPSVMLQNSTRIFESRKSEEAKANQAILQNQRERIIFIAEKKEIKSKPIICFIEDFGRINVKGLQEGEIKNQKIAGKYISVDKSDKKAEKFAIGTLNSVDNHKINLKEAGAKHAEVCKECLGVFKQTQLKLTMSQG